MTFNKLPSIFKQLRPVSIGFDNIFDHFENFFDEYDNVRSSLTANFPFYNIVKKENNKFDIEVALAGCLLYTSPSPRDGLLSRMPSSA